METHDVTCTSDETDETQPVTDYVT
jgi:hypothetical protein